MEIRKLRYESLIDLGGCKLDFTLENIQKYIDSLCEVIGMEKHGEAMMWEDSHNKVKELQGGVSACQFVKTSSIVFHSFETFKSCYIDIFSCKDFDRDKAVDFSKDFFQATSVKVKNI